MGQLIVKKTVELRINTFYKDKRHLIWMNITLPV